MAYRVPFVCAISHAAGVKLLPVSPYEASSLAFSGSSRPASARIDARVRCEIATSGGRSPSVASETFV
jgi:hypothetical protein